MGISKLPFIKGTYDYFVEMLGINFHYTNISRGVIDTRDLLYFLGLILVLILITIKRINHKN
ncbi:MAG: hypothetical protein NTZ59_04175 [Bacteroidetes bacterium]|nr:hypothetical protein [Bacteroidota bacterium]